MKLPKYLLVFFAVAMSFGCKKNWLDEKPDLSLVVPSTIGDYQALLDNNNNSAGAPFNKDQNIVQEVASNDYTITDADISSSTFPLYEKKVYLWDKELYEKPDENDDEWRSPYKRIFYANVILEGIEKIVPTSQKDQNDWNQVKGSALFFRGYNHFQVAQLFCDVYDPNSPNSGLGIPLRLTPDFNQQSTRSTIAQTYQQIISDVRQSIDLLPVPTPQGGDLYKMRPNKSAANALLARVYLSMSNYDSAFYYADKSLQLHSYLHDFKTVTIYPANSATQSFLNGQFNDEVLHFSQGIQYSSFSATRIIIDTNLVKLYEPNDLRKAVFFRTRTSQLRYFGSYTGLNGFFFTGLSTAEMFLIRAECLARKGNFLAAMDDVNAVRRKRWTGTYTNISASSASDALTKVLLERRKELCFRGLRWIDLRRLNLDPQFAVTLSRTALGQLRTLQPKSSLYIWPIPPDVIRLSGMTQNNR